MGERAISAGTAARLQVGACGPDPREDGAEELEAGGLVGGGVAGGEPSVPSLAPRGPDPRRRPRHRLFRQGEWERRTQSPPCSANCRCERGTGRKGCCPTAGSRTPRSCATPRWAGASSPAASPVGRPAPGRRPPHVSRLQQDVLKQNLVLVGRVREIAERIDATPVQVALARLAQGGNVIPIPGPKILRYLLDNAGAADVQLSEADLTAPPALEGAGGSDPPPPHPPAVRPRTGGSRRRPGSQSGNGRSSSAGSTRLRCILTSENRSDRHKLRTAGPGMVRILVRRFVVMSAARMLRLYDDDGLGTASRGDGGPQKTALTGLHQGWIRRWRRPAAVSSARPYNRGAVVAGPRRHRVENSSRGGSVGRGVAAG